MGGLVIEAHVHGLPQPTVKFYRDGHLLHARKNKVVFFVDDKEIFQCLLVRPDASVSGTYTILAESKAGKKRFDHSVDFVTKYPLIHLPMMRHADKKLEDFVAEMLEKIPKQPEQPAEGAAPDGAVPAEAVPAAEPEKGEKDGAEKETAKDEAKPEVPEVPKAEEIAEALTAAIVEGEVPAEKPKKHHHHKSKSKKKKTKKEEPKIDADLVDDGEDEKEEETPAEGVEEEHYKRKFSTVVHEPYETETFRIFNAKNNLWFSGGLRDQTAIEGQTIKLLTAVSGPLPIMKWLKNGKPVPWSATVRNMSGEGLGLVIIEKISKADAGVYACTARNQFMSEDVVTTANIKVIPKSSVPRTDGSKPHFTRVLGEFYHNAEDDLILDAHVRAVPDPKIKWYKDGVEINAAADKRYDFTTDHDGGYQLRINKPKTADSGLYACEAVNSEGKAKVSHKVNFTELNRHTHPQFVYHKEGLWQPTLRMSIEPEPIPDPERVPFMILPEEVEVRRPRAVTEEQDALPKITQAAGNSGGGGGAAPTNDSGSSDNQESSGNGDSSGGGVSGGSGTGGDGNEDGEDGKENKKEPADATTDGEVEEKQERKPEKRKKGRKRYEGPFEPLLIRDSVDD